MNPLRDADRFLRAAAYGVLSRRDRLSGWKQHREAFLECTRMDAVTLARHTEHKLRSVVKHAYETSPYYAEAWDKAGFRPTDSFRFEDLSRIPFLTKEIVKNHKAALMSRAFDPAELDLSYTGGTTGTQTSFYLNHGCWTARFGRRWGIHQLCGYRPGMRRALVWGVHSDLLDPSLSRTIKRRLRKYATSDETLCCTVMSAASMLDYHARLLRFRPEIMYGYPSALVQLGRFMEQRGLPPVRAPRIITTAERLSDVRRRELARLFGGEVFSLYGTREYGCVAFECGNHGGLHIDAGSVIVEIIDRGGPVEPGQSGEIVITDLLNYGMPFIRSRTGDLGALSPEPCGCGSPLPLLTSLDGRSSEIVYRPDGSLVPGLMLTDLLSDMPSIRLCQYVQHSAESIDVRLVVTDSFTERERDEVERQVRGIMGQEISVRIRLVDDIERNPRSGKIQEVICKVSRHGAAMAQEAHG